MLKIQRIAMVSILVAGLILPVMASAEDNSCVIVGGRQNDVWVIIYDADRSGNRGEVLWRGKIEAGQQVEIVSSEGHIRYDYTLEPNDPYKGDVSVGCFDKRKILVR